MFNIVTDINVFAIIASTLLFTVLGGLYFAVIVARPYRVALGIDDQEPPELGPVFIVGPMVSSWVVVTTTAVLLPALAVVSVTDAAIFGLVVSIGYLVAQTMNIAINPNIPRPFLYTLINAPYFIVCTVAAAIVLTLWQ